MKKFKHLPHSLQIYLWVPSFLWSYFIKPLDPQNGHCSMSKEFINSISKIDDVACLASYQSWTVFSTSNCPSDFSGSSDQVNKRKDGYFLRSFRIHLCLAVRSFTRWIIRTAKFLLMIIHLMKLFKSLPFYKRSNYSTACNNLSLTTHLQKRS